MGGLYGNEFDFPEWNIVNDLNAAQITFKEWPTPIIASGWELGNKIRYPHQSILNDFAGSYKHPLCVSYKIYQEIHLFDFAMVVICDYGLTCCISLRSEGKSE